MNPVPNAINATQADALFVCHPRPPDQGAVGKRPRFYLAEIVPIEDVSGYIEVNQQLHRTTVRDICRNQSVPVLQAYAVAMAWGGQKMSHFRSSSACSALKPLLEELRKTSRDRIEDFRRTHQVCLRIPGLGISFFTKLLFFFRPSADAYILDTWTGRGVARLLDPSPIRIAPAPDFLPDPRTTAEQYGQFCEDLERLGTWEGRTWSGEEVERALFDRPRGAWRKLLN